MHAQIFLKKKQKLDDESKILKGNHPGVSIHDP
jgi:hypothetical protein